MFVLQGLSELIISPGSIVVIPYHMSDNVSVVEKPAILHLAETVASILIKVGVLCSNDMKKKQHL